jgi:5-methylcytosine-specific restriction endonuclease McrA
MSSKHIPRSSSRFVAERAGWQCEYCLSPAAFSTQPFEVDHIIPRSKGGLTTEENLAFSCGCNRFKGTQTHARDPQTGRVVPLFNPRRQRWSQHFAWSEDFTLIIGRTATGRATVEALHLNRPELINLRRALRALGEHPPESVD